MDFQNEEEYMPNYFDIIWSKERGDDESQVVIRNSCFILRPFVWSMRTVEIWKRFPLFKYINPHTNIHFYLCLCGIHVVGTKETQLDGYKWVQSNKSKCRLFSLCVCSWQKTQQSSCLAESGKDSFPTATDVPQHTKEINTQ